MNARDFMRIMQQRTAVAAVGPSALRGQGRGVLKKVQAFLGSQETMSLSRIPMSSRKAYINWLNRKTQMIRKMIAAARNRQWGTARKALNLFMRDVLYNKYLCRRYKIRKLEPWLEVPLDGAVARGLKHRAGRDGLPRWPGLKDLRSNRSKVFQDFAKVIARGFAPVHLDMELWLENR